MFIETKSTDIADINSQQTVERVYWIYFWYSILFNTECITLESGQVLEGIKKETKVNEQILIRVVVSVPINIVGKLWFMIWGHV